MNQQDPIVGKQPVELATHRSERARLHLDQQIAASDVDHKSVEFNLDLVTAFDEKVFQSPV